MHQFQPPLKVRCFMRVNLLSPIWIGLKQTAKATILLWCCTFWAVNLWFMQTTCYHQTTSQLSWLTQTQNVNSYDPLSRPKVEGWYPPKSNKCLTLYDFPQAPTELRNKFCPHQVRFHLVSKPDTVSSQLKQKKIKSANAHAFCIK